jgi:hypothetical protein
MGNFKIEIEAVGNHGTDRTAKQGEAIAFGDPGPSNPDALAKAFTDALAAGSTIVNAKLTHWPDTTPIVDNLKTGHRDAGDFQERWQGEEMLEHFAFGHLPEGAMRETSRLFNHLAYAIVRLIPHTAERTVALRKLLEGKDAAVRAARKQPTLATAPTT